MKRAALCTFGIAIIVAGFVVRGWWGIALVLIGLAIVEACW